MFTHTDAAGRTMLVAEMSDEHLLNNIKLLLRRIKECSTYIDALDAGETPKVTALHRAAYGDLYNPNNKERAKQLLNSSLSSLPKYVMEGCLRGLSFTAELQETFERKTTYTPVMPTLFLSAKNTATERFDPDYPLHK